MTWNVKKSEGRRNAVLPPFIIAPRKKKSCSIKLTKNEVDEDDNDEEVEGVTTRDEASHTLLFTPNRNLSYDSVYTLTVTSTKGYVLPHSIHFKTSLPPPIALVLCREGHRYPAVIENFDKASPDGLNRLKNKAKELLGGLQDKNKSCSQIRLAVALPSGEGLLEDDESVNGLNNLERIMVMFDGDGSAESGAGAIAAEPAAGSHKRGRSGSLQGEA